MLAVIAIVVGSVTSFRETNCGQVDRCSKKKNTQPKEKQIENTSWNYSKRLHLWRLLSEGLVQPELPGRLHSTGGGHEKRPNNSRRVAKRSLSHPTGSDSCMEMDWSKV